jgi:hypothetical protein
MHTHKHMYIHTASRSTDDILLDCYQRHTWQPLKSPHSGPEHQHTATTLWISTAHMHYYISEDRTAALLLLMLLNFHLTICTISPLPTSPLTVLALLWAPHISSHYLIHHIVPSLCLIQNHQHPYWLPVDYQVLHSTTSNSAAFRATSVHLNPSHTFPDWLTYFYIYCHHTNKVLPNTDTLHPTIQETNELVKHTLNFNLEHGHKLSRVMCGLISSPTSSIFTHRPFSLDSTMHPKYALPAIARPLYEATISFWFIHPEDGNCKNEVNTEKTSTPDMT